MINVQRRTRHLQCLVLALMVVLALGILPSFPAHAASVSQDVDNSLASFSNGQFQRSSLATLSSTPSGAKTADKAGAVQLSPIGILKGWKPSSFDLPERLLRMGAVVIGNRIYIVGGISADAQASTDKVWSVAVDQKTGAFETSTWDKEPNLPAVQTAYARSGVTVTEPIAAVNSAGVVAVQTSDTSGFIYVLGGNVTYNSIDFSSFAVRMGKVVNGRITEWVDLGGSDADASGNPPSNSARIPSPTGCVYPEKDPLDPDGNQCFTQLGLQSPQAFTFTTSSGTYVYLVGGLQRYYASKQIQSLGSSSTLYAKVASDGRLVKPSNPSVGGWDVLKDADTGQPIPLPFDEPLASNTAAGLWDGMVVADAFPVAGNGVYLVGGQRLVGGNGSSVNYSNDVYRARIGEDGKPSWFNDNPNFTLPQARVGLAGVVFRGTIYATGGQPNGEVPDRAVLTSYVRDSLDLPVIGDGGSNFLGSQSLPAARTLHSAVYVRAKSTTVDSAYVFLLGGRGISADGAGEEQGTRSIIYTRIGQDEEIQNTGYAPDGWYYSDVLPIDVLQAEVREIRWSTQITRTATVDMDVAVYYRAKVANDCTNPGWSDADWVALDGSADGYVSKAGTNENSQTLTGVDVSCFQYRARLSTNDKTQTPSLLNVAIQIYVPGAPDLKQNPSQPLEGLYNEQGQFTGLKVSIINQNTVEDTLDANIEEGGSFVIDLFIYQPGQQPPSPLPSIPFAQKPSSQAFANIAKGSMTANATLTIRNSVDWYETSTDQPLSDLLKFFPVAGTYTVVYAIDTTCAGNSYGCVNESSSGGESNNWSNVATITVPAKDPTCTSNCAPDTGQPNDSQLRIVLPLVMNT